MIDLPVSDRQACIQAFLATWELFPEPACLLDRSRRILAANALGRRFGMTAGGRCQELNPENHGAPCRMCRANEALDRREAVTRREIFRGQEIETFWIPLPGRDDFYIHFGLGTRAAMEA